MKFTFKNLLSDSSARETKVCPNSFKEGVWAIFPMLVGTAPFGIVFGVLAVESGLGFIASQALSVFVFAGASQFIGVSLFTQGASLLIIFFTTLLINLRHFLYGAALGPKLSTVTNAQRLLMSFFLTDETFAVLSQFKKINRHYFWGVALAMYINWQVWTCVGIFSAGYLKDLISINFSFFIVPAFLIIVIRQMDNMTHIICGLLAGLISLFLSQLPNHTGLLLASLISILITLWIDRKIESTTKNQ